MSEYSMLPWEFEEVFDNKHNEFLGYYGIFNNNDGYKATVFDKENAKLICDSLNERESLLNICRDLSNIIDKINSDDSNNGLLVLFNRHGFGDIFSNVFIKVKNVVNKNNSQRQLEEKYKAAVESIKFNLDRQKQ